MLLQIGAGRQRCRQAGGTLQRGSRRGAKGQVYPPYRLELERNPGLK